MKVLGALRILTALSKSAPTSVDLFAPFLMLKRESAPPLQTMHQDNQLHYPPRIHSLAFCQQQAIATPALYIF